MSPKTRPVCYVHLVTLLNSLDGPDLARTPDTCVFSWPTRARGVRHARNAFFDVGSIIYWCSARTVCPEMAAVYVVSLFRYWTLLVICNDLILFHVSLRNQPSPERSKANFYWRVAPAERCELARSALTPASSRLRCCDAPFARHFI